MIVHTLGYFALFTLVLIGISIALGWYMARVFDTERPPFARVLGPVERACYRLAGVDPAREQRWTAYAAGLLLFNLFGLLLLYGIQRLQAWLPLNPQGLGPVSPLVAWNTAVSFVTNTNWQAYAGESTMSIFTQMAGLAVQNFLSAATGIVAALALARGLARQSTQAVGNVWVDLTRATLYVLLPLALVGAIFLVWQGVPQTLHGPVTATTLEGAQQVIPRGPVASQEAIKMLGTNGGGYFNANSAHPYENPTPLTNLAEILFMLAIPAALPITFGYWVKDRRQGWAIWAAMAVVLALGVAVVTVVEQGGNPLLARFGVDQHASILQPGGNFEGKEVRFGIPGSSLFAVVTTAVSCGAVNSAHDSYLPLAGLVPMFNMQLGEIIFGGVGSGLYGMLVFVLTTVFIAGLMVGRTPEYLGKKIGPYEIKLVALYILISAASILVFTGLASALPAGRALAGNPGPHGFSELLYAYSSTTGNNGSAFGGYNAAATFALLTTALAMLFGRFPGIVLVLALAGSLAAKKRVPPSLGTMPTHTPLFVATLIGVILIVGGLTYLPGLALGPIVEHLLLVAGRVF
ncbi:MAG: potassium-transporting ATPase subunit KdpA [Thermorudis peleae]|nr:potassium-transporting ATPase subunit KdpA [Thermorudis peleae]